MNAVGPEDVRAALGRCRGGRSVAEIAVDLVASVTSIRMRLATLERRGEVERVNGTMWFAARWRLTAKGAVALVAAAEGVEA